VPQTKQQQRRLALARRDAMGQEVRVQISQQLATQAERVMAFAPQARVIAGFWPIRSEIDPRPLMFALSAHGAQLALPALIGEGQDKHMIFRAFARGDALVDMGFGTFGPSGDEAAELQPGSVLLPLAAFDGRGNRIGYGGGFYDRTLAAMHGRGLHPKLIGLGFDCQEVESIAAEPHDIRLEAILTERGLKVFG